VSARFAVRFRARSYELDMLGHVNNAVFLNWLEQARLQVFEELGWRVEELIAGRWSCNVVRIEIDYRREVRFGDEVELDTRVEAIGRSSITLAHQLRRTKRGAGFRAQPAPSGSGELVAEARAVVVWLDTEGRPTPVPDEARAALSPPEA
jgi:YbgC/YbaW family acyl-CoA thioester hydrolase